jgi:hypothetical protein
MSITGWPSKLMQMVRTTTSCWSCFQSPSRRTSCKYSGLSSIIWAFWSMLRSMLECTLLLIGLSLNPFMSITTGPFGSKSTCNTLRVKWTNTSASSSSIWQNHLNVKVKRKLFREHFAASNSLYWIYRLTASSTMFAVSWILHLPRNLDSEWSLIKFISSSWLCMTNFPH